ncbi:hypothetical protein B0J12DRAFT_642305 [Macrophomina phaseolina]|uniref:Uncharacterized protein n=1 Tax=Macrophomina phaseolina TaxID=35725 RepID=A0ABQ8GS44_9PEZI|nr:hypothetical protein B0J12DRAFT_642305 [Macrophomina phaseolina]
MIPSVEANVLVDIPLSCSSFVFFIYLLESWDASFRSKGRLFAVLSLCVFRSFTFPITYVLLSVLLLCFLLYTFDLLFVQR